MPKGSDWPRRHPVTVGFGEPIAPNGEDHRILTDQLQVAFEKLAAEADARNRRALPTGAAAARRRARSAPEPYPASASGMSRTARPPRWPRPAGRCGCRHGRRRRAPVTHHVSVLPPTSRSPRPAWCSARSPRSAAQSWVSHCHELVTAEWRMICRAPLGCLLVPQRVGHCASATGPSGTVRLPFATSAGDGRRLSCQP